MFFNGGILSSSEGVLFGCPGDLKVVTISEDMMLNALRKIIMNTIRGCIILLDFFYRQLVCVGDGCIEYEFMKLKCNDDEGRIFFIFSKFSSKGSIELNTTFGRSPDEIPTLLHTPMKPIFDYDIITLTRDKFV